MIVLDTSALLAILGKEPERDRFLDVLIEDDGPLLSAVTFYETMLVASTKRGQPADRRHVASVGLRFA
jgi:uncharacterized protein with PIN domain